MGTCWGRGVLACWLLGTPSQRRTRERATVSFQRECNVATPYDTVSCGRLGGHSRLAAVPTGKRGALHRTRWRHTTGGQRRRPSRRLAEEESISGEAWSPASGFDQADPSRAVVDQADERRDGSRGRSGTTKRCESPIWTRPDFSWSRRMLLVARARKCPRDRASGRRRPRRRATETPTRTRLPMDPTGPHARPTGPVAARVCLRSVRTPR
mmetsp:Transcript_859/g.1344  ORF Transcript_859/g.1344 Transcript_859/m.1344 type:complete len:211 (-) Transcript_859:268-900(-)